MKHLFSTILMLSLLFSTACSGGSDQLEDGNESDDDTVMTQEEAQEELDEITETVGLSKEVSILNESDIDKFIETIVPMTKELEALSLEIEESSPNDQNWEAMLAQPKVVAILDKYGWDNGFFAKSMVISMGYAYAKGMEEYDKMEDDAASQQAKTMMKQMMGPMMEQMNDADLALVASNTAKLDDVINEMNEMDR